MCNGGSVTGCRGGPSEVCRWVCGAGHAIHKRTVECPTWGWGCWQRERERQDETRQQEKTNLKHCFAFTAQSGRIHG